MLAPPTDVVDGVTLHVYVIDDSEKHWYVATSDEDAFALFCDPDVAPMNEDGRTIDDVSITRLDDGQLLALAIEDDNCDPVRTEKTAREWVAEFGRGFMGSTVF